MTPLFRRLGLFIENRRLWILVACAVLILGAFAGATRLTMASGFETFISPGSQTYKDYERFNQNFSSDVVVTIVTGDSLPQLLKAGNLQATKDIEQRMSGNPAILSTVSPASLIEQYRSQNPGTSVEDAVVNPETGEIRPELKRAFPDQEHAVVSIALKGNLPSDEVKDAVKSVESAVEAAGFNGVTTTITGMPVMFTELEDLMSLSLATMFIVAVALMLLILAVIFKVRGFFAWRWLPLGVVIIGIIYAFGLMGVLSVPITMVSMAVFPVLIGLGVDYAIQFHNRYDEEARRGETTADAIIDSVTHIGPAIGIAIIAACLGFVALFFSPVPMVRDFGLMLIIGVVACYAAAMFVLLSILYWHDRRKAQKANAVKANNQAGIEKVGFVEKGLRRLAPWVIKNPAIILSIAVLVTVGGFIADSNIKTETEESKFLSQDLQVMRDLDLLESLAGGVSSTNVLIEADDVAEPSVLIWMADLEQRINQSHGGAIIGTSGIADLVQQSSADGTIPQDPEQVKQILAESSEQVKMNLINSDYTAANLIVNLREIDIGEGARDLNKQLANEIADPPDGVSATLTGSTVIGVKLFDALTTGRMKMTYIGIAFIFAGVLLLFRLRLFRALAAILPIILILGWSSGVMFLAGIKYTPLTATLGALILGIGTEFTILLMMRYYEERGKGEDPSEAMITAVTKIGRAIIASGLTVIGGFAALLTANDFLILRDFGIVTMINVFFALVSTLVVLPALIVSFDRWREHKRTRSAVYIEKT